MKENAKNEHRHYGAGEPWTAWEILHRLRLLIVTASLIAPVVILSQSKVLRDYWDKSNPIRQAERLIAGGSVDPTYATVLEKACEDAPDRPDLLRALAGACGMHNPSLARRCYEKIEKLRATTADDIAGRALLLARLNSFADAEALLESVPSGQAGAQVLLRAKLTVKIQGGDSAGALRALDELCHATPDDPDPALEVAASCAKSGADAGLVAGAERHATAVLVRWNKAGYVAALAPRLEKLLNLPLQEEASRTAARGLLAELRDPTAAQVVATAALSRPASFSGREQERLRHAYRETSRKRGGISAEQKDEVANFLQHQGDHALVLQLIPTSESVTERTLFQRRMTSMLHLGQWREASETAGLAGAPLTSYNHSLFLALKALNRAPAATNRTIDLLENALRDAGAEGRAEACYAIGCAALEMDLKSIALDAFSQAMHLAPADPQILESIINSSRRCRLPVKDLNTAVLHGLEGRRPGPLVAQRLCYLNLLDRRNLENVRQYLSGDKRGALDSVYVRFLEALERYQRGEFSESFRLLMPLPDYCWHQGETAVIIGILCSAGGADQCRPLARTIDPAKLFPEERAMMEPWLTRLSLLGATPAQPDPNEIRMAQR